MAQATIRDVARAAAVSVASVSRVLNGHPNVRAELRARVQGAAERLGYVPHAGARNLSLARTGAVGVVLPDLHGEFFSEVIRGMDREAALRGMHLLLSNVHAGAARSIEALQTMRGRVDGVVVMAPHLDPALIAEALPAGLPAVLVNCPELAGDHVALRIDNAAGATAMVEHLIAGGRRAIAHLRGPRGNIEAEDRLRGYRTAIAAAGLEPLVLPGHFDEESGRAAVRLLAARGFAVDALFAANDMMAIGAMMALRDHGIDVPGRIAVAGFDNVPLSRLVTPALTTMAVDIADLGGRAINRLAAMIQGHELPATESRRPSLIVRASTSAQQR